MTATYAGNVQQVRDALANGANVNAVGEKGGTALLEATAKDKTAIAVLLLEHHASVNQARESGDTPLHRAAFYGHADMVALLLSHGASREARNRKGHTPLDNVLAARRLPSQNNSPDFIKTTTLLEAPANQ